MTRIINKCLLQFDSEKIYTSGLDNQGWNQIFPKDVITNDKVRAIVECENCIAEQLYRGVGSFLHPSTCDNVKLIAVLDPEWKEFMSGSGEEENYFQTTFEATFTTLTQLTSWNNQIQEKYISDVSQNLGVDPENVKVTAVRLVFSNNTSAPLRYYPAVAVDGTTDSSDPGEAQGIAVDTSVVTEDAASAAAVVDTVSVVNDAEGTDLVEEKTFGTTSVSEASLGTSSEVYFPPPPPDSAEDFFIDSSDSSTPDSAKFIDSSKSKACEVCEVCTACEECKECEQAVCEHRDDKDDETDNLVTQKEKESEKTSKNIIYDFLEYNYKNILNVIYFIIFLCIIYNICVLF